MRDPARIDAMVNKLRAIWHASPDQRLGQLITNLAPADRPLFYVEDDVMQAEMDLLMRVGFGKTATE
jgi:hypothetical protein